MGPRCKATIAAQHCSQVFIKSPCFYLPICDSNLFSHTAQFNLGKMFGISLLCNIYMLDLLRVCRRSSHGLSLALSYSLVSRPAMPAVHVTVHPRGLHPTEADRAWHRHVEEGMSIRDACVEVLNMVGETPSYKAEWPHLIPR